MTALAKADTQMEHKSRVSVSSSKLEYLTPAVQVEYETLVQTKTFEQLLNEEVVEDVPVQLLEPNMTDTNKEIVIDSISYRRYETLDPIVFTWDTDALLYVKLYASDATITPFVYTLVGALTVTSTYVFAPGPIVSANNSNTIFYINVSNRDGADGTDMSPFVVTPP